MSDNMLLKFWYLSKDVDVFVEDIDKVMLIDLMIEYWDNAEKNNTKSPEFPCFSYLHKMAQVYLNNDKDLMQMFSNLEGKKEIYIWVEMLEKPTDIVKAAMSLRGTLNISNTFVQQPTLPPKKLTPRRSSRLQTNTNIEPPQAIVEPPQAIVEPPQAIVEPPPLQPPVQQQKVVTPRRSTRLQKEVVLVEFASFENDQYNNTNIEETWADIVSEKRLAPKGRGRGKGKVTEWVAPKEVGFEMTHAEDMVLRRSPRTTSNTLQITSSDMLKVPHGVAKTLKFNSLVQTNPSKKLPKTTAIRKGLLQNCDNSMSTTENGKRRRCTTVSLSEDADNLDDQCDNSSDGSDVYSPSNTDEGSDGSDTSLFDEDESVSDDNENENENECAFMVYDNFDPFDDESFSLEDDNDRGNYFAKLYKNGELYHDVEFGQIMLKPWQIFMDKQHLRDVVRDYCIQSGFSVIVLRANNIKYTVICADLNCGWRLHAGKLPDGITWAIKSIQNEHSCVRLETNNPMVNVKWAVRVLMNDIRANNDVPTKALNDLLFQRFGVQMVQSTLYRVRKFALLEIHGGHDVSYSFLPNYCEMIKSLNTGSVANCAWKPAGDPERPLGFTSIFISFKAATDGVFAGSRRFVGVDGAHLKGNYGGVLLSAVALDANNEIFPFSWAIVAGEDEEAWKFFLWHIKHILAEKEDEWCIISDRMKGIDKAIVELWPTVDRRYCCKHLSKNFKRKFPGPLMLSLFWKVCGAYSKFTFVKAMKQLQKVNKLALVWLSEVGEQSTWSKHAFKPRVKCDLNKSNFVLFFNATLGIDRCRHVLTLLEGVRRVTMVRMATRRQVCESWDRDDICPNIIKRLQVISNDSRTCIAYLSGDGEYEVVDGKSTLPVSLNNMTCVCGAWQISGLPCKHAMRAIHHARLDPHKFVSEWYSVDMYKRTYQYNIKSIPDKEQWSESTLPLIQPPSFKRGVGRPPRNRRREEEEQRKCKRSSTVKCGICKEFGHNSKTCKGGLTTKEKVSIMKRKRTDEGASTSQATVTSQSQNLYAASTSQATQPPVTRGKNKAIATTQPPVIRKSTRNKGNSTQP